MAQKRKKIAVKKALPASKKGKVKQVSVPKTRKKVIKKPAPTARLINKAVKKIKSRPSRHSDEWLKKIAKTPVPVPKKSTKKTGKPKRKLPPIKYRGKNIPDELADKVRFFRAQAVKNGKFYTNKFVLKIYYKLEKQLMDGKNIVDDNDPLKMKKKVTEGISTRVYELRGVVNALIDIRNDVGDFTIAILGFGESNTARYNSFGPGLRKVDQELGYIYEAFNIYEMKYGLNSPLFSIILVWDRDAKIAFIDFNKTIFQSVDPDIILSIIIGIKRNMGDDVVSQLSDEQVAEIEKSESELPAKKKPVDKKPTKKKSAKKKAVVKKSVKKKPVKKKQVKKKIVYPVTKEGYLDMRYKQNRDLEARREKSRKTRLKNKRAAEKAAKERVKKYAAASEKRRATIKRNKRAAEKGVKKVVRKGGRKN